MAIEQQNDGGIADGWAAEVREVFHRIRRDMAEAGTDGLRVRARAVVRMYEYPVGAPRGAVAPVPASPDP